MNETLYITLSDDKYSKLTFKSHSDNDTLSLIHFGLDNGYRVFVSADAPDDEI